MRLPPHFPALTPLSPPCLEWNHGKDGNRQVSWEKFWLNLCFYRLHSFPASVLDLWCELWTTTVIESSL